MSCGIDGGSSAAVVTDFSGMLPRVMTLMENIQRGDNEEVVARTADTLIQQLEAAKESLDTLKGGDITVAEQEERLAECTALIEKRRELLEKYQSLPLFQEFVAK